MGLETEIGTSYESSPSKHHLTQPWGFLPSEIDPPTIEIAAKTPDPLPEKTGEYTRRPAEVANLNQIHSVKA